MERASIIALVIVAALSALASTPAVHAHPLLDDPFVVQDEDLIDRPIGSVDLTGLRRVDEQLVRNNLRAAVGEPFAPRTVSDDVRRLTRLALFKTVSASADLQSDGTVRISYNLVEQPIIQVVQVVGNKLVSDQDLRAAIRLSSGDPRDDFRIQNAKRAVETLYRERGHYLTAVSVDETDLEESGILVFRVIEGPRVRIRVVEFEGNVAFTDKELMGQVKSRRSIPFIRKGVLDEDKLRADVSTLDGYYKDNGFLDVRVDFQAELSPDNSEAKIIFYVDEGARFLLSEVVAQDALGGPPPVFAVEQIRAMLDIKAGDNYSRNIVRGTVSDLRDSYRRLGHLEASVQTLEERSSDRSEIKLLIVISAGRRYRVGLVEISGNFLTKDKVIRREVKLPPGRPFDGTQIAETTRRLQRGRLFNDVKVTLIEPDDPESEYRDVLVEVRERDTGSVNFGAAIGSDAGLFGEISVNQTNFDIADLPESFNELIKGRSFRGAGQRFSMVFRPGTEFFEYGANITEPRFLDTNYSLRVGGSFYARQFSDYDEERFRFNTSLARKLGDIWDLGVTYRFERVKLDSIDADAPTDVFDSAGPDNLSAIGFALTRNTITTITRPGSGSNFEFAVENFGLLGGDFDFNKVSTDYTIFFTLNEDFLERKTTLKFNMQAAYIFGSDTPPTYERYYLGGRTFRGFEFRTISPKGVTRNGREADEIGGEWLFFAGAQYEYPLVQEAMTGVFFIDSGTVTEDFGPFDDYRVSIGAGVRLYVDAFGPVPLAFDFAVPLVSESRDETQVFSFTAEFPF